MGSNLLLRTHNIYFSVLFSSDLFCIFTQLYTGSFFNEFCSTCDGVLSVLSINRNSDLFHYYYFYSLQFYEISKPVWTHKNISKYFYLNNEINYFKISFLTIFSVSVSLEIDSFLQNQKKGLNLITKTVNGMTRLGTNNEYDLCF